MTSGANTLVLPIVLPLLGAFLLPLVARFGDGLARALGIVLVVVNIFLGWTLWSAVGTEAAVTALGGFEAPLGIVLYGDRLAALFVAVLAVGALIFWPRAEHGGVKAYTLTLLLVAGGSGLVLSGDLFNIFVFYEIVAVASYGLAASSGDKAGFGAALRYLVLGALGSSLVLIGIGLVYAAAGTLNLADIARLAPEKLSGTTGLAAFLLLVLGFGVKAELFPVNTWVPEVYAAAPMRVTAILAGVVSKLAMVVILRLLVLVFHDPAAISLLMAVAIVTIVAGEFAAYRASDLNRTFAYSSIAQLGLVALALTIPATAGILAAIAVALHHAVVKPAFFVIAAKWRGPLAGLAGGARVAPAAAGLFVLLALSIIGIPPLPGFWAKLVLLGGAFDAGGAYAFAAAVVLAATVVEAAYLFRVVARIWQPAAGAKPAHFAFSDLSPALLLGVILIVATLFVAPIGTALSGAAASAADAGSYVARVLPGRM